MYTPETSASKCCPGEARARCECTSPPVHKRPIVRSLPFLPRLMRVTALQPRSRIGHGKNEKTASSTRGQVVDEIIARRPFL